MRKYAVDESDDTERVSVELNQDDAAKTILRSDDCSKYDLDMAELKLHVTMLTALLHEDQEKLTSQSVTIVEFQALTEHLLRENEKRVVELESVKATINHLTTSDKYIIRVDDNKVNGTMILESRSSNQYVWLFYLWCKLAKFGCNMVYIIHGSCNIYCLESVYQFFIKNINYYKLMCT